MMNGAEINPQMKERRKEDAIDYFKSCHKKIAMYLSQTKSIFSRLLLGLGLQIPLGD